MKTQITIMNIFFVIVIIALSALSFNLYQSNSSLQTANNAASEKTAAAQQQTANPAPPILFLSGAVSSFDKDSNTITIEDYENSTSTIKYDEITMFNRRERLSDAEYKTAIEAYKEQLDKSLNSNNSAMMPPIFPPMRERTVQMNISSADMAGRQVSILLRSPQTQGKESLALSVQVMD